MSQPYANTISGLFKKRSELMDVVKGLREQMAVHSNDIEAIERSLISLGYKGEFRGVAPRSNRVVFFHRDELRRFCIDELRKATRPISSRDLAEKIITLEGKDPRDRAMRNDMVKRVGKSLKLLRQQAVATSQHTGQGLTWQLMR